MTGDRPLAVEDRRRITRPGVRRAVNRAARKVRCPECNRAGSLTRQRGQLGACWSCGATFDLRPVYALRPSPWLHRPPSWTCEVHPVQVTVTCEQQATLL